ncbi:MAG TPA: SRPBCC domain-containing protein, partial [Steroidobacteraceae bacterium]|nr:SRPBCC domain-containing protein [Steroidobacteraceae bacterium]
MNQAISADTIIEEITIKAHADRIFAALTSPEERVKWWGAEGRFKATHVESDLRVGGKWSMSGIGVGGGPFTVRGVYREVRR